MEHKPDDVMQVDMDGDTLSIRISIPTGETVEFFLSTMSHRGYTYYEGYCYIVLINWITAHANALEKSRNGNQYFTFLAFMVLSKILVF